MFKLLENIDHCYNCEFRMRLCKDILSVMLKNIVKRQINLINTLNYIPRSPDGSIDILHKISRELFNVQFVP